MPRAPFYLFVHDLGATPLQWEDLVVSLPPGAGAACPWLRGLRPGAQTASHGGFTVEEAAADLVRSLDEHGARRATLVGVGLGGVVALHAAAQAPERATRVVAVSTPAEPSPRQIAVQRAALKLVPRQALASRNLDKGQLMDALKGAGQSADDAAVRAALDALTVPITLVAGAKDPAGVAAARLMGARWPHAEVRIVPGQGRDLPRTAPKDLATDVFAPVDEGDDDGPLDPWDLS